MEQFWQNVSKPRSKQVITVVSGLPRSGTSMMMQMLQAGGIPSLTDRTRNADEDNPKGYYELERVKKLDQGDTIWLEEAQGKAVKVISALLKHLPQGYTYKVIFMRRAMAEILASQRRMLIRRGESDDNVSDEKLTELFEKHLELVETWLAQRPEIEVVHVSYNEILANPVEQISAINQFLDYRLDEAIMVNVVDPALYRQQSLCLGQT